MTPEWKVFFLFSGFLEGKFPTKLVCERGIWGALAGAWLAVAWRADRGGDGLVRTEPFNLRRMTDRRSADTVLSPQHLPEPTRPAGRLRRTGGGEDDRHIFVDAVIAFGARGYCVDCRRKHFELPGWLKCSAPFYSAAYPRIPKIGMPLRHSLAVMLKSCPFCLRPGKKVKAHIIPQAFFEDISEVDHVLRQRELGRHSKKMPTWVYDDQIWCQSCEIKYGKWDSNAISILRTSIKNYPTDLHTYELQINNLNELRLFFISLIWRASTSKKRLYDEVSIGSFADLAKNLLESGSPGSVENFSTIVSFSGTDEKLIASPVRVRYSGVWFYRFYLGRFNVNIKVSNQPTPKNLLPAVIGYKDVLVILFTKRDLKLARSASMLARQLMNNSSRSMRKAVGTDKLNR